MIFREYQIYQDVRRFRLLKESSLIKGDFDYFEKADSFLAGTGEDFLPVIEIQEFDKIEDDYKQCLRKMFFLKQLKFFLAHGWVVKVFDLDNKESEIFGCSTFQDSVHARELGITNLKPNDLLRPETIMRLVYQFLYGCGRKAFWIECFTCDTLIIHTTLKKVSKVEALHCKG